MSRAAAQRGTWRMWHERGCDFFGYAWGTPPEFAPHTDYRPAMEVISRAFHEIERARRTH